MDEETQRTWEKVTSDFVVSYWLSDTSVMDVQGLIVQTMLKEEDPPYDSPYRMRKNRRTQEEQKDLNVVYSQKLSYTSITSSDGETDPVVLDQRIATMPFQVLKSRNAYIVDLQDTGDPAFDNLSVVSQVIVSPDDPTPPEPSGAKGFFQENWLWIVIGAAGLVALMLISVGIWLYCRRKKRLDKSKMDFNRDEYFNETYGTGTSNANLSP